MIIIILAIIPFYGLKVRASSVFNNGGVTYYVDSMNGNDKNNGKSPDNAWNSLYKVNSVQFHPGDKILFKSNSIWNGQLRPHGSGTACAPIIIDMYGNGNKPIINGQGIADKEITENKNYSDTLLLNDQQYWEINNLELTNSAEGEGNRRIVYITAGNIGECKHIYLKNLYVHDVKSESYLSGGIIIEIYGLGNHKDIKNLKPTYFNDIKVENCRVENVGLYGIFIRNSIHMNRGAIHDGLSSWVPNKNVVIRNNSLNHIMGDGIVAAECDGAVVENNVASNCHERKTGHHVAIWTINSDNSILQNNEAYLTRTTLDGKAYDCDGNCKNTTFQYNYSHDNEGGFMLICNFGSDCVGRFSEGNVIRYNISQNDKNVIFDYGGATSYNNKIYNNTVYIGKGMNTKVFDSAHFSEIYNNIIYNLGSGGYNVQNTCSFDYNCYYGNTNVGQPQEKHGIYADPRLISPDTGSIGRSTVYGYRIKADSPCIDSGKIINNNGMKDYFGQPAPYKNTLPDIGACEYQGKRNVSIGLNNDFNSVSIGRGWRVIRNNKNKWSLKERPGYLRIKTEPGDLSGKTNNLKNIIVKSVKDDNYAISTKMDFSTNENGQNAGLIIYGDDDNYYILCKDKCDKNNIIVKNETNGELKILTEKLDNNPSSTVYLKIKKIGNIYTSYYSGNNKNWIKLFESPIENIENPKIGVYAGASDGQEQSAYADFDYIHYNEENYKTSSIVDNFNKTALNKRWSFVNEDNSKWSLTERPGYMRIKSGSGDLGNASQSIKNIMLMSPLDENYSIEASIDFMPIAEGQKGGILIYGDADNYISIDRELNDKREFVIKEKVHGVASKISLSDDVIDNSNMYYKIEKHGNSYNCYIKTNDSTWYNIGSINDLQIDNAKVGTFVTKGMPNNTDVNLDIDSFTYNKVI